MSRILVAMLLGILLIATGCSSAPPISSDKATELPETGTAALEQLSPGATVLSHAEADFDGDDAPDLAVVFRDAEDRYRTVVFLDHEGAATPTVQFKAPVERQSIEVRDIDDKKTPVELIVRGWKGSTVGYAIYRIESGELVDVFGSNMADCCGN